MATALIELLCGTMTSRKAQGRLTSLGAYEKQEVRILVRIQPLPWWRGWDLNLRPLVGGR